MDLSFVSPVSMFRSIEVFGAVFFKIENFHQLECSDVEFHTATRNHIVKIKNWE